MEVDCSWIGIGENTMSYTYLPPITGIEPGRRTVPLRTETDSPDFRALMEESLRHRQDDPRMTDPPVSKEQLTEIVHKITMQMDASLMRAFAVGAGADVEAGYPGLWDRAPIPHTDSSNKQHLDQNIDTTDPGSQFDTAEPRSPIDIAIDEAARTHGVDPALVRSVIQTESNFDPNATSPKGAMGLMQLMPETARELGVQNGYDPVQNISAGTRYLKMLLKRYDGDVSLALSAYNWGMGNVEKRPEQMPKETRRYVDQVTRRYAALKA